MTSKIDKLITNLNKIVNDLHDYELSIFKNSINEYGQFKDSKSKLLFEELGKTRKQLNQLIYLLESFSKK